MLDENELLYSQQVQIYTDRVSAGGNAGNLVSACLAAARQMGNQSIEAIWSLVDDMLKVGAHPNSKYHRILGSRFASWQEPNRAEKV